MLVFSLLMLAGCSNEITPQLSVKSPQTTCQNKPIPRIGMTRDEVRASCWGEPQGIMESDSAAGKMAVLNYPHGTVYLSNGVVTKIERTK
jgi:hypothetical protein